MRIVAPAPAQLRPAHQDRAIPARLAGIPDQLERSRGAVIAHHRDDRRAFHRGAIDRTGVGPVVLPAVDLLVGLTQPVERERGGEHLLEQAAQRPRDGELLDGIGRSRVAAQVEHRGDRGSDAPAAGLVAFVRDGVHLAILAVDHCKHVAVGREMPSERIGELELVGARAQQDLRGPERARGEDQLAGVDLERLSMARAQGAIGGHGVYDPAADAARAAVALDAHHARAGVDGGAVVRRLDEQVEVEGILRAEVAAGGAIAAFLAMLERHHRAGRRQRAWVDAFGHADGDGDARVARGLDAFQCARLGGLRSAGIPVGAEHSFGAVIVGAEIAQDRVTFKQAGGRPQHHARVDERAPAEPIGDHRIDVGAEANVEKALETSRGARRARRVEAHVTG